MHHERAPNKLEPAFQSRLCMTVDRQKLTYRSYPA